MSTTTLPHQGCRLKFLLVEDDPKSAEMIIELMGREQCHVQHCLNGEEALQILTNSLDYDVVLLDYGLPGKDGLQVADEIRHMQTDNSSIPIVILTGNRDEKLASQARSLGINGFMTKPFSQNKCNMLVRDFKCRHRH